MLKLIVNKLRKLSKSYEVGEFVELANEVKNFADKKGDVSVIHCFVNNGEDKTEYWVEVKVVYSDCEFRYFTSPIWRDTFEEASKDCKQIVNIFATMQLNERVLDDSESTEYLYE